MSTYTCPVCDDTIPHLEDGILKRCKCTALGIDCTDQYVRIVGVWPKEDPNFEKWSQQNEEMLKKLRANYQSK